MLENVTVSFHEDFLGSMLSTLISVSLLALAWQRCIHLLAQKD